VYGWADPDATHTLTPSDTLALPSEPRGAVTAVGVTGAFALVARESSLVCCRMPLMRHQDEADSKADRNLTAAGALPETAGRSSPLVHQLPLSRGTIVALSAGEQHCLLVTNLGAVFSLGANLHGECGVGHTDRCEMPTLLTSFADNQLAVRRVACGRWHSVAVCVDGACYSWGRGDDGQLGLTTEPFLSHESPQMIEGLGEIDATECAAGSRHTVVVTEDGMAWSFGWNRHGQLGRRDSSGEGGGTGRPGVPGQVKLGKPVAGVACGAWHSLFWCQP
jgi:hypothetical protein